MPAQHRPQHRSDRTRSASIRSERPRGRQLQPLPLGLVVSLMAVAMIAEPDRGARAASGPIQEVVRSLCLSAFETEVAQSGKKPPDGMARFACDCVAEQISSGSSIASARSSCRDATVRRYPI